MPTLAELLRQGALNQPDSMGISALLREGYQKANDLAAQPAFGMDANIDRLSLLPRYSKQEGLVAPGILHSLAQALTAPGQALRGQEMGIGDAMNVAGALQMSSMPALAGKIQPGVLGSGVPIVSKLKTIKTQSELEKLVREANESDTFVRWSRGPSMDKKRGYSRDFASGTNHDGLSAVPINPYWADDPEWMTRRISEYGFLRMKDPLIAPYVYKAKQIGNDSDGYSLINEINPLAKISPKLIDALDELYSKKK